jgi:hypothetical protein
MQVATDIKVGEDKSSNDIELVDLWSHNDDPDLYKNEDDDDVEDVAVDTVPDKVEVPTDTTDAATEDTFSYHGLLRNFDEGNVMPGLMDLIGENEYEDNETGFKTAVQDYSKAIVQKEIDSVLNTPEDKALFKFRQQGGTFQEFYKAYYEDNANIAQYNLESKEGQMKVVQDYYKETAPMMKSTALNKLIDTLDLANELQGEAKEAFDYFKNKSETSKVALAESKEKERIANETRRAQEIANLQTTFKGLNKAGNIPLSEKLKTRGLDTIFTEQGRGALSKSLEDPENYFVLTILEQYKGKDGKWDLSQLAGELAKTTGVQQLSKSLKALSTNVAPKKKSIMD